MGRQGRLGVGLLGVRRLGDGARLRDRVARRLARILRRLGDQGVRRGFVGLPRGLRRGLQRGIQRRHGAPRRHHRVLQRLGLDRPFGDRGRGPDDLPRVVGVLRHLPEAFRRGVGRERRPRQGLRELRRVPRPRGRGAHPAPEGVGPARRHGGQPELQPRRRGVRGLRRRRRAGGHARHRRVRRGGPHGGPAQRHLHGARDQGPGGLLARPERVRGRARQRHVGTRAARSS